MAPNCKGVFNTVPITLKPQLPRLDSVEAIKSKMLVPTQAAVARLQSLISKAETRIAEIRALVSGPSKGGVQRGGQGNQPIRAITDIRKSVEAEGITLLKQLGETIAMADEMSQRHWSIRVMLRLAKPGGIAQATALRAQYATILAHAGAAELAGHAQTAIDSADPVLMDAVIRENDTRKRDERAFLSPGVMELFGSVWEEYKLAQAMLYEVVTTAKRGGLIYAEFDKGIGAVSVQRISQGLRLANATYRLDESGGIVLMGNADDSSELDAIGASLRKLAN